MLAQYRRGYILQWNDGSIRHLIDVVSSHHVDMMLPLTHGFVFGYVLWTSCWRVRNLKGEKVRIIYICVWVSVLLCGSQFVCRERQVVRQVVDRCINKGGHNCGCLLDYGMHDIYPQLTKCCIMVKCMWCDRPVIIAANFTCWKDTVGHGVRACVCVHACLIAVCVRVWWCLVTMPTWVCCPCLYWCADACMHYTSFSSRSDNGPSQYTC